jgi:hypothetical protein
MDFHALILILGAALGDPALLGQDLPRDLASEESTRPAGADAGKPSEPARERQGKRDPEQEPRQDPFTREPDRLPRKMDDEGIPWIDFDWLELHPRVGLAMFTSDYRISPTPFVSVLAHVPVPLLSLGSSPGAEWFGIYLEADIIPSVTRDLNPAPDHSSGMIVFMSLGLDFTLIRDQSLYLVLQVGVQYAHYGGIADLNNGMAPVVGLAGGVYLGKGLTLTLGSQVIQGDSSSRIYLNSLGLMIEF